MLIEEIVLENHQQDQLKAQFVDTKLVSSECAEKIFKMFPTSFINRWLLTMVSKKNIKEEDVYKYKEYIDIFLKSNKDFPIKDLGQIKTNVQVNDFVKAAIGVREKNVAAVGGVNSTSDIKNLVTANEIDKLKSVGINFLGLVDGYQCFEIPKELKGNVEAFTVYKNILARCSGRDSGAKIDICTMANQRHFDDYLSTGPYFVFFNMGDPQSPYQFHYETSQFMDKNDTPLI
jgi:hypothetical protein